MSARKVTAKVGISMTKLRRAIIATQKRIASERDKLRDLIDEAEQIESDCKEAVEYLNYAADKLSELQ